MKRDLPRRVYLKHGAYWFVDLARKWHRLCAEKDGLPAMYRALAALSEREATSDRMPAVISRWMDEKRPTWAAETLRNKERMEIVLARKLAEFTPASITTADCDEVLGSFRATPRTHNQYRDMLRQVLAYAARKGLREGWNPVDDVPGMSTPGRKRAVTDAELAAIRKAALVRGEGDDAKAVRNGQALISMIDLALLTGQRISDVIKMRWQDVTADGLYVEQGKRRKGQPGKRLLIELTPALRAALNRCAPRDGRIGFVLKNERGSGYTYAGIRSAWVRACVAAGVEDLNIHDLRGRAGVDKTVAQGIESAKDLLGHDQLSTTEHYVEGKRVKRVKPTR